MKRRRGRKRGGGGGKEAEVDEEDTSVMIGLDLPPGRQKHKKLTDQMICLANCTTRSMRRNVIPIWTPSWRYQ